MRACGAGCCRSPERPASCRATAPTGSSPRKAPRRATTPAHQPRRALKQPCSNAAARAWRQCCAARSTRWRCCSRRMGATRPRRSTRKLLRHCCTTGSPPRRSAGSRTTQRGRCGWSRSAPAPAQRRARWSRCCRPAAAIASPMSRRRSSTRPKRGWRARRSISAFDASTSNRRHKPRVSRRAHSMSWSPATCCTQQSTCGAPSATCAACLRRAACWC